MLVSDLHTWTLPMISRIGISGWSGKKNEKVKLALGDLTKK